jgi:hypothetical protein
LTIQIFVEPPYLSEESLYILVNWCANPTPRTNTRLRVDESPSVSRQNWGGISRQSYKEITVTPLKLNDSYTLKIQVRVKEEVP